MAGKVKLGVIGAGRIAHVHTKSVFFHIPNAEIKTIADPYLSNAAKEWAAELGVGKTTLDPNDIFQDPEIDAVLICSSTNTHAQFIREAANAGKHIFCEKPIDHDEEEISKTLEIVEKAGVKLQVGFNRRFDHNFKALKEAVVEKSIGDLHMVRITSRDPEPPPIEYVKSSGGLFMDMMIHDFDMVRFLTDSEAKYVYASGAVLVDEAIGKAGDIDSAIVTIEMESGVLVVIENSRRAAYGYDQRAEVFGDKGAMESGNDKKHTGILSTAEGVTGQIPFHFFLERYEQAYAEEMKSFADAIAGDTPVPVNGFDGLAPVKIAKAALKSLGSGKKEAVI